MMLLQKQVRILFKAFNNNNKQILDSLSSNNNKNKILNYLNHHHRNNNQGNAMKLKAVMWDFKFKKLIKDKFKL